jgi:hypothetical protein
VDGAESIPDLHEIAERNGCERVRAADGSIMRCLPMEQRYLRVDGSAVEVEVTASSIMLAEGRAVLSIARDITRRRGRRGAAQGLAGAAGGACSTTPWSASSCSGNG